MRHLLETLADNKSIINCLTSFILVKYEQNLGSINSLTIFNRNLIDMLPFSGRNLALCILPVSQVKHYAGIEVTQTSHMIMQSETDFKIK